MSADLGVVKKALASACPRLREGGDADTVGAAVPSFVAAPSSTAEAAALLRAAAEHELAVVPRGSGSRVHWGAPVARCDLVIDTLHMAGVLEHAAGDLVARVQAGATISAVADVLAAAGQEIALDVPPASTIGGVVADALAGPRRLRYGSPRDLLIGITVVRADGTVARSGGKVVKNVAGYDLGKLFAGSAGTLGLITEVTFRLHPLPAARAWVTATFSAGGTVGLADAVARAAASPLVPSAAELHRPEPGGPASAGVLLEGSAEGVAARADRMADLLGEGSVADVAPQWWQGVPDPGAGTLVRVSFWVSALGAMLDAIDSAARTTGASPVVSGSAGAGVLYLTIDGDVPADAVARFVTSVRAQVPAGRGAVTVLAAAGTVRSELDGPGGLAGDIPGLRLMHAVKDQFDPGHRMAPGRFPS